MNDELPQRDLNFWASVEVCALMITIIDWIFFQSSVIVVLFITNVLNRQHFRRFVKLHFGKHDDNAGFRTASENISKIWWTILLAFLHFKSSVKHSG